jgi:hypothetical protein
MIQSLEVLPEALQPKYNRIQLLRSTLLAGGAVSFGFAVVTLLSDNIAIVREAAILSVALYFVSDFSIRLTAVQKLRAARGK